MMENLLALADVALTTNGAPALEPEAAAAIAVGLAALATGYAQRGIGSAAVGAVAEDSDNFVSALIFTDIGRDGMMRGCNVEATRELARAVDIPVIASGGVSTLEDVRRLAASPEGIAGAIVGRAIYDGGMDLAEAIRTAQAEAA